MAVGAVHVSGGGYDWAWQMVGSETFTIWSLDSQGNFIANIGNNLAGNSTALENFETIFNQDFNGDGTVGAAATTQASSVFEQRIECRQFCVPQRPRPRKPTPRQTTSISTAAQPVRRPHRVAAKTTLRRWQDTTGSTFAPGPSAAMNSAPSMDVMPSNSTTFAHIHAALATTHEDAFGNAAIPDAAHLWAHHSGFHFV